MAECSIIEPAIGGYYCLTHDHRMATDYMSRRRPTQCALGVIEEKIDRLTLLVTEARKSGVGGL